MKFLDTNIIIYAYFETNREFLAVCFSSEDLSDLIISFLSKDNIKILDVSLQDYLIACEMNRKKKIKINDCLAAHLMRKNNLREIYTFDDDFKEFNWISLAN